MNDGGPVQRTSPVGNRGRADGPGDPLLFLLVQLEVRSGRKPGPASFLPLPGASGGSALMLTLGVNFPTGVL